MRTVRGVFFVLALMSFVVPPVIHADSTEVGVTPVVIDEKAKVRDILKQSITVRNLTNRKIDVYPSVNDVIPAEGPARFVRAQNAVEREASLANWIELSRGVIELGPGEEKNIPFVIRVNMNAIPGRYHAAISFSEGTIRDATGSQEGVASVMVNIEVQADIKEVLQLNKFAADSFFLAGDDILLNYQLQNIGNQELEPKGEVRVYNRKGEEVAALDVNAEGKVVGPDEIAQLASVWTAAQGFGRFKAFLNVEYGSQTASVQDTVYFWIIPWQQLIGMLVGSLIAIVILALYFHRWFEERHLHKLAHAGLLKPDHPIMQASPAPLAAVAPLPVEPRRSLLSRIPRISLPRIPIPKISMRWGSDALEASDPRKHAVLYDIPESRSPARPTTPQFSISERPAHVPMRERIPLKSTEPHHGGTINLKKMGTRHSEPEPEQNHVINLKKPR